MKNILFLFFIFLTINLFSQSGSLTIHQSDAIKKLMDKHLRVNEINHSNNGYRLQIFTSSGSGSKEKAYSSMSTFLSKFPGSKVYVVYQAPYFKVRVGNFRTQLDALKYLQIIKSSYPFAFVVVDKIEIVAN